MTMTMATTHMLLVMMVMTADAGSGRNKRVDEVATDIRCHVINMVFMKLLDIR